MDDPLVCTLGDLVDDVVVETAQPGVRGADVPAIVTHHRGGSAANVAAAVARCGGRARFVGNIGDDAVGDRLRRELEDLGVECPGPRRGRTATVVVVVEPDGERTMYSDRGAAATVDACEGRWLDGAHALHVPYYSFQGGGLEQVAYDLAREARRRGLMLSYDTSSVAMADDRFADLVRETEPDIVFCNEDEAAALGVDDAGLPGAGFVVVKQGAAPALLRGRVDATVPAHTLVGPLDTTGAGDAFAGGFLVALTKGADPIAAARAGHDAAAHVVRGPGADAWVS